MKKLKGLNLARTKLVETIKTLEVHGKEREYYESNPTYSNCFKHSLKALKADLKRVELDIKETIKTDERLKELFGIVESIKEIGPVEALNMILTTNEFKNISDPRKYACYSGVVPFEHRSGSSIKGRPRESRKANMYMKSILYMTAMSSIQSNTEIKEFYVRKLKEGKAKMNVINAVKNKLIHRIFACVRDNRKYENSYTNSLA